MENHIAAETWSPACRSDELAEASTQLVVVGGLAICVYRVQGAVYATDDRCTHGNAQLSDGDLEGHEIECPYHQGRFDVRTGQATMPPCVVPITVYPTEERNGVVWVATS